jgi:hypothetical protein
VEDHGNQYERYQNHADQIDPFEADISRGDRFAVLHLLPKQAEDTLPKILLCTGQVALLASRIFPGWNDSRGRNATGYLVRQVTPGYVTE